MSTAVTRHELRLAAHAAGLDWLTPGSFELDLLTDKHERLASVQLGPRDFLPMAHCALRNATASGFVQPGEACRVAGLHAVKAPNGQGEPVVQEWYLALTSLAGDLVKVMGFDIRPFATRACRESLARELDPTQILYAVRQAEKSVGRLGAMTVVQDIPQGEVPDMSDLTLIGESPEVSEPVYIWPTQLLERFAQFASAHPSVEVLAAVLGRPYWAEDAMGRRILVVEARELVLVPPELCEATAITVNVNQEVAAYVRESKTEIESRLSERLSDLGTLHPHLPVAEESEAPEASAAAEVRRAVSAFFSVSDRATMFTKYYLPHQVAMIWNVPDAGHETARGRELASQFQQWCWSSKATMMASSGFYLQGKGT